jgi:hypothetical protein
LIDPRPDQFKLGLGQRIRAHGHSRRPTLAEQPLHQQTLATLSGNNHIPRSATAQEGGFRIESELPKWLFGSVTGDARGLENGRNIAFEIDLAGRRGIAAGGRGGRWLRFFGLQNRAGHEHGSKKNRARSTRVPFPS